jgi:hypothetical protein
VYEKVRNDARRGAYVDEKIIEEIVTRNPPRRGSIIGKKLKHGK